ncbi:MAG: acyl-CoA dehydrogenase family protein [Chloroflexi bacterium]|nr:acyl-CoA dehydrogenase family protein [Chloroflexota bacterium]
MDFTGYQLPEELKMLQTTVRKFVAEEIVSLEHEIDYEAIRLSPEHYRRLSQKAKAAGLWCLGEPAEYGGGGLNTFAYCVVREEMAQHRNGLYGPAYGVLGNPPPAVIYLGTPEQIQKFAVPVIREGHETYYAITEPSGGSDPARAIQTRAKRDSDYWVLNGTKVFIAHVDVAEWGVVFARTDSGKGRAGISCFVLEKGTPGLSFRTIPVIRPLYPFEIHLQDCRVPTSNLLGNEGEGFALLAGLLGKERFPYSAAHVGVCVAALRMAISYVKQRETFGELLSRRQAIQWMLADSDIETRAARWLVWEGAWKMDHGEDYRHEASIAKLFSSEVLMRVIDRVVQIHGGYGVSKDLPLERWYREARVRRIGEGPSEVHRMVIARDLLRD